MTHRIRPTKRSFSRLPALLGIAVASTACSPRDDVAENADRGGNSGSGGVSNGGTATTGGYSGSQADTGGSGSSGPATGGSGATGGNMSTGGTSGTGTTVGCDASNTIVAPANGLIASFMDRRIDIPGELYAWGEPAPTFNTATDALYLSLSAPAIGTGQIALVVDHFESCVDATAFEGVEFLLSGSLSDCLTGTEPEVAALGFFVEDSAHLESDGNPTSSGSHGTALSTPIPLHAWLTSSQVTSTRQTVRVPFADQVDGLPDTPLDEAKITGVGWAFGFGGACVANVTVDDVRFY